MTAKSDHALRAFAQNFEHLNWLYSCYRLLILLTRIICTKSNVVASLVNHGSPVVSKALVVANSVVFGLVVGADVV